MQLMETPYLYAGSDETGIDCSGFVAYVFRSACDREVPRSVRDLLGAGRTVARDSIAFGDLLFFDLEGTGPSHVGLYLGDRLFAHASSSRGVTVSLLDGDYYRRRYVMTRRLAG